MPDQPRSTDKPRLAFFHASPEVEFAVAEWFASRALPHKVDGDRSIRIAHPDYEGLELKIKGAGFRGGAIMFGKLHQSNLKAPIFDFDGRMMEDVASGHDNAFVGGASFQQTIAEHRMSLFLQRIHVPHVLCTAYGKLEVDAGTSWFSLHDWDPRLVRVVPPSVTPKEFASAKIRAGKELLDLALCYNIIGHCGYAKIDDRYFFTDLHPFRQLDAFNMSQISWVMQVIFNLHVMAFDIIRFLTGEMAGEFPPDVQVHPFRCAVPDVTRDDHEDLRWTIIAPYMLDRPKDFSMRALCAALARNRIGRALLELCPREFERP
jgi:hypothetical protein